MEIILTQRCKSLTGSIGSGFGYYIRSTKTGRFFSQRSKHNVPPDGHWRFIWTCAELAYLNLHIADIRVKGEEINEALREAGIRHKLLEPLLPKAVYNAPEILRFKEYYRL